MYEGILLGPLDKHYATCRACKLNYWLLLRCAAHFAVKLHAYSSIYAAFLCQVLIRLVISSSCDPAPAAAAVQLLHGCSVWLGCCDGVRGGFPD